MSAWLNRGHTTDCTPSILVFFLEIRVLGCCLAQQLYPWARTGAKLLICTDPKTGALDGICFLLNDSIDKDLRYHQLLP
jgi:hypothetical protein